jgi:hypothetical protein
VEKRQAIDAIRKAHPIDVMLFGEMGAVAAHLCEDLSNAFNGKQFDFMDVGEFQTLKTASKSNQVYWREILYRVHWAAALNVMRHQRWQAACVSAFNNPANLLAFAASLRGLLEASQDAWYSLGFVVKTLAQDRTRIESALTGRLANADFRNPEFEERLIHFVYARKVGKEQRETAPTSHIALEPKDYRNAIGLPEEQREVFRLLYDHLCGICHPTAFSLLPFWEQIGENCIRIRSGRDDIQIKALCLEYEPVVTHCLSLSVTTSALCLKALNWFPLSEVKCASVEHWNFDDIPAWRKAQAADSSGNVH